MGLFKDILNNIKNALKLKNFWLKVFGLCLNIAIYSLWREWGGYHGMVGPTQLMIFLFTVPPSNVVFTAEMMVMFLGKRPDMWFHRVYNSVGGILYGTVGVVAIFNRIVYPPTGHVPLIIAAICFVQCFVLILDMLMNENYLVKQRQTLTPVFDYDY